MPNKFDDFAKRKAVIFFIVLSFFWGCDRPPAQEKPRPVASGVLKETTPVPVEVVLVRRGDIFRPISATGNLNAWQETHVGAKIGGRIQRIFVKEGDQVAKGTILFQLDQTDFILAKQGAQAQLAVAQASLAEAKIHLDTMTREKERFNRLFEKNAISQQKNDEINSGYLMALSKVELAGANLAAAQANLALAQARLEDTVVAAPFAGLIFRKAANEAEMISAGLPLISIMNIDRLKLEVDIPEIQAPQIRKGVAVEITVDALPGKLFSGQISVVNPRVNPQNRSFKVEIFIANEGHIIQPGMFSRITIKTDTVKNAVIIPLKALLTDAAGRPYVLAAKDNRALRRNVTTGIASDSLTEIKEGLQVGETVLVSGNYGMEEGVALAPRIVSY